ncbi:MAG: MotA/TolQ/ExbB proton channel family protein [Planctomycetes bacterium]|nr:MotA/TolQ/ExbB proton channel family protein [Planctomycetota bacterium]
MSLPLLAAPLLSLLAPAAPSQGRFLDLGSLFDKTVAGGILMVPIGTCSILLLAYAFERAVVLRRSRLAPRGLVRGVEEALRRGDLAAAASLCRGGPSAFAAAIGAGLARTEEGPAEVEKAIEAAAQREINGLRKNLRAFAVITTAAPLLGLLGTVQGMIQVFDVVAAQGALGNASLLSGGISTALVTTFAGLTVAIPSLLCHQFFTARIQRFADEVVRVHHDVLVPALTGSRAAAA